MQIMLKFNGKNNPLEIILKKIYYPKKYGRSAGKIPIEILKQQSIKLIILSKPII